jgi:hypothetical protein
MVEEHETEDLQRQINLLEEDIHLLQCKVEDLSVENTRLCQQLFYIDISDKEERVEL